jgi:uncharacterized protein YihD (DUF1040 family)
MDFKKLKECTEQWNSELKNISELNNIDMKYLKRIAQEIGFQTKYSYSEAITIVSNDLQSGLNINQIILKYNLDKELI